MSITTSYQHLHFRYSQDYVKKEFCDSALLSQNNTFGLHWGVVIDCASRQAYNVSVIVS
jgi:hypothetical protein